MWVVWLRCIDRTLLVMESLSGEYNYARIKYKERKGWRALRRLITLVAQVLGFVGGDIYMTHILLWLTNGLVYIHAGFTHGLIRRNN